MRLHISDSKCEAIDTVTLNNVGADAATYKLGDKAVSYEFSVTAKEPSYCKYTMTAGTIPATLIGFASATAQTATANGKFTIA